jgi:ArsR family transcriptional regulator, arsenate/arsenite/antimonite-responsive transcriptional repressor
MLDYLTGAKLLKALSDPTRLKIMDMVSCSELCACDILEGLTITQSTLSHHMKVLLKCRLVMGRKEATWMYYSINRKKMLELMQFLGMISSAKERCICQPTDKRDKA